MVYWPPVYLGAQIVLVRLVVVVGVVEVGVVVGGAGVVVVVDGVVKRVVVVDVVVVAVDVVVVVEVAVAGGRGDLDTSVRLVVVVRGGLEMTTLRWVRVARLRLRLARGISGRGRGTELPSS